MDFLQKGLAKIEKKINKTRDKAAVQLHNAPPENSASFTARAAEVIPADIKMFSGCKDHQTSADVNDVAAFGLPKVDDVTSAGGACTNSMLSTLAKQPNITFGQLLIEMQAVLKKKRYQQIPQLSSSHQINLKDEKYTIINPRSNGRTKALLIGINYVGQQGELGGCVNDVKMIHRFITQNGFASDPQHLRLLTDDQSFTHARPTGANIIDGMKWLVQDAQPGDSLFFHYSGHGGQMPDDNGDEEDGYDETLIPEDYARNGQIRDDLIYKLLVVPLKQGVQLVAVFDCCHSGTILDLPFMFSATDEGCAAIGSGAATGLSANPFFNFAAAMQAVQEVAQGIIGGLSRGIRDAARGLPGPIGEFLGK